MGISKNKNDVRFQSVSGLSVEYDMEDYKEGGENRFVHKLPVRTKYADLVLKRGMLEKSEVISWCLDAFRDREFKPADINVILMNEKGKPLRTWKVAHAVPKKWLVSDLNANESSVIIETMELTYRYFTIQDQ
ncbi:MAG: phage tail protein [Candidatus Electrothrix sp. EH2]|nr:phage tail protein [Candidatus Electrothrix sp. EH2]